MLHFGRSSHTGPAGWPVPAKLIYQLFNAVEGSIEELVKTLSEESDAI